MSALTTEADFFGSVGCSDPIHFNPGLKAFSRKVNFKSSPIEDGVNYEFLALPALFVITGILCREISKCDSASISLACKSDSTALKSALAVGAATEAYDYTAIANTIRANGDMVCLSSSADITDGEFEVTILGYLPNFDSKDNLPLEVPYRASLQTKDNVSGGDPYLKTL